MKRVNVELDEEDRQSLLDLCRSWKKTISEVLRELIRQARKTLDS